MLLLAPVAMLLADELLAGAWVLVRDILEQIVQSAVKSLAYPVKLVKADPLRDVVI